MTKFGFDEYAWESAKAEGRETLILCARERKMIPYSEFVSHVHSISFDGPHDPRLAHFLREISTAEARAGRGMLTALVVHKYGDYQPGPGFFELAKSLGHDTSDVEKFWIQEIKKIFAAWQQ